MAKSTNKKTQDDFDPKDTITPAAGAALGRVPDQTVGGIAAKDLEVLEGDIDSRMKALLKDHQAMGVRPK